MKLGYLHIGPLQHGVCRYGRLIAAEARRRPELEVVEAAVVLGEDATRNREALREAAHRLSMANVVHFQFTKFNRALWGERRAQMQHLKTFLGHCSSPLVVTLHDVFYPPYHLKQVWKRIYSRVRLPPSPSKATGDESQPNTSGFPTPVRRSGPATIITVIRSIVRNTWGADASTLQRVARGVRAVVVCTEEERRRLEDRIEDGKLTVIPHFVEGRSISVDRTAARKTLGLAGVKVVTLLGFIFPFKGHQLVVDALPHMPEEVRVIFAGGSVPGRHATLAASLAASAEAKGRGDRLRITGYLAEDQLNTYLAASDLAVCPFPRMSASSSLATWISVGCPILASDLPQIAEYNQLEAGAIHVFRPYTSIALAEAVRRHLTEEQDEQKLALRNLAHKLSISAVFDQHLICYRAASLSR